MSSVPRCLLHGVGCIMSAARCPFRVRTVSAASSPTTSAARCRLHCCLPHAARSHARAHARCHPCARARTHARARACGSLWWGTAQAPAAAKQEDEVRPLWRPAARAHVAAVMLTEVIGVRLRLRVCRVHCRRLQWRRLRVCRVHCRPLHVVGCTVAWLRLVRCNVVRRALSTARRLSHGVPMHQCIPFHSACLVHVMRDSRCCSVSAARFSLPVAVLHGACCTSSAARRQFARVTFVRLLSDAPIC